MPLGGLLAFQSQVKRHAGCDIEELRRVIRHFALLCRFFQGLQTLDNWRAGKPIGSLGILLRTMTRLRHTDNVLMCSFVLARTT